ncbi:DUF3576 domain-containing protein [Sulfitobacter sabulilitoris]|uniref:DUF3576 domain-containing protein n=1 Tax=Sulfitobacter sabulilitoris TaxID=2562655 RepID=A0A5S3PEF2_9RHOB|nr:DUF3576 domain-containing protein [Sulfitobacter sabulilitoris]TMM52397.1 DUF3576 domain-containing protein [Sulfitobacter sabulilitoris]
MGRLSVLKTVFAVSALVALGACGSGRGLLQPATDRPETSSPNIGSRTEGESTIWDIFRPRNTETNVAVNKYLWSASLEVLNFLPVQSVDPFTGVIVTGYGTPPGGGRAYRATILIDDPALDARSLNVALLTQSGPANAATVRAVEDAILSRARQLRIADNKL